MKLIFSHINEKEDWNSDIFQFSRAALGRNRFSHLGFPYNLI